MAYHTGDQNKKSLGETLVDMMVRVFTMAAFLLVLTPIFIAPMLGVTPEAFAANEIYWTLVSLALGWIIAIPISKLTTRSIKNSGAKL